MSRLFYLAHRYRDADHAVQAANLARAIERLRYLRSRFEADGIVLWAPWIGMAKAGLPEDLAWLVIERCVRVCHGIVLDLDGAEASEGMMREKAMAEAVGGELRTVR
jgi:hypothetical protein